MTYSFEQGKDAIIQSVLDIIQKKLKKSEAANCALFTKQMLNTVALDDLVDWKVDDLYAAILNFWQLIYQKVPGEQKIRIYNPDYERHGWQTTHTVIEIIHDDMPFLVDSIHMEITRMNLTSHLIVHMGGLRLTRDKNNKVKKILTEAEKTTDETLLEAPIFIQIDRISNLSTIQELSENLERVLEDNRKACDDWQLMRDKVRQSIDDFDKYKSFVNKSELNESKDFLSWVEDHHFTFLGVRDYKLTKTRQGMVLEPQIETGLGVLRGDDTQQKSRNVSEMTPEGRDLTLSPELLIISKTNTRSTVHRRAYTDYIGIKKFNEKGDVIGERRIIGLYTSIAYHTNPKHIPLLRRKVGDEDVTF